MAPPELAISSKEVQDEGVKTTSEPGPGGVLAKVLSKTTSRVSIDPGPPPDGGLAAWTQVVMGHLIVFNTWGYINSFGVFQTYYVATLGHPPSDISWVRTLYGKSSPNGPGIIKYDNPTIGRVAVLKKDADSEFCTGGISPDISALFCRYFLRTSHRLWSFQINVSHWLHFAVDRCLHDVPKHQILATIFGPRHLHRPRKWTHFLSSTFSPFYIFQ